MASGKWWIWYNVQSGDSAQIIQEPTAAAVEKKTGFPPIGGPFNTRAEAVAYLNKSGIKKKTTPHNINPITQAESGLQAVSDFLSRLGQASLWERAAEIIGGLILIAVGVARLTRAVPLATKIASAVK